MPDAPRPNIDHLRATVPAELRACAQWVCWRRKGDQKMPVDPRTGRAASTTNPSTWATFDKALEAHREAGGKLAGVGFVFSADDPFCGIDLDDCIDDDCHLAPWAAKIVEAFRNTYAEISPSGRGLKIFAIGAKPDGPCKVRNVECYDRDRYFTLTGRRWTDSASDVSNCQDVLEWFCREYLRGIGVVPHPTNLTSNTSETSDISDLSDISDRLGQVIEDTLPTARRERNDKLFLLARRLKFDLRLNGRAVGDLKPFVRMWHQRALPLIATKSFTETWSDFIRGWEAAKIPPSANPVQDALERARKNPAPEAAAYDSGPVRLLVSLCRELAGEDGAFFLSSHDAAKRIEVSQPTALGYLRMLQADGIIKESQKGNEYRASRYRWLSSKPEADNDKTAVDTP